MRPSDIALLQQIPVAIIARALGLEPGGGLVVAPSTPLLTARIVAQALPDALAGKLAIQQLSFGDVVGLRGYTADYLDGTPITHARQLYDGQNAGSRTPVLVDAIATRRRGRDDSDLAAIAKELVPFVDDVEPGYLDLGDWGPYFWCLFARAMARGAKAAVLIPAAALEANESARIQLVRAGFIEQVVYLPIPGDKHRYDAALLVLSDDNAAVSFSDCSQTMELLGHQELKRLPGAQVERILADASEPVGTYDVRYLLRNHAALSLGAVRSASLSHGYDANLGRLFSRIPPFMPRESLCSSDTAAIRVRRISSCDFSNGNLLPEDAVTSRYAKMKDNPPVFNLAPGVFERYALRVGDIVMPRLLGYAQKANMLVIRPEAAEQHLVASHNMMVIRPVYKGFANDDERGAYSEMVAAYLTDGHGAKLLEAISAGTVMRSVRPAQLEQIEVPPALEPGTAAYAEHVGAYIRCVLAKREAETALAKATADLAAARADIARELESACS